MPGDRLPAAEVEASLREAGRRLGSPHASAGAEPSARLASAVRALEELGGGAHVEAEADHWAIRGQCCPLADLVADHPGACVLVESLLAEVLGGAGARAVRPGRAASLPFPGRSGRLAGARPLIALLDGDEF